MVLTLYGRQAKLVLSLQWAVFSWQLPAKSLYKLWNPTSRDGGSAEQRHSYMDVTY